MIKVTPYILLSIFLLPLKSNSQDGSRKDTMSDQKHVFAAGLRFQQAVDFYWYNGFTLEYSSEMVCKKKISLALNVLSSKMGTAASGNAIPFYEIDLSLIKYFRREKQFKPLLRLNAGYAHANYQSDVYKDIPNQSMVVSLEAGAAYDFKFPFRVALGGGLNLITGNGTKGLGVLYPVYGQFSLIYRIKGK